MNYSIVKTPIFDKKFHKIIPKNLQDDIRRRIQKLADDPYIGKPLGSMFFRELKADKFRVYYRIREDRIEVILITVSDKKHQEETIQAIKNIFKE